MLENPRLRLLDVNDVWHEGRRYLMLRDPMKITQAVLLVPFEWAPVLVACDGATPAPALGARLRKQARVQISDHELEQLLQTLDDAAMFENATFARKHAAALKAWRRRPWRPLSHAEKVYPAEADALDAQLAHYFRAAEDVEPAVVDWAHPVGLLSPHIDYARGGDVYARVWKRAAQAAREAEVVVVFATDHYGSDAVTLTRLPYATPYGALPPDARVIEAVECAVDKELGVGAAAAGELRHGREHSVELVLNWLHHLRGGSPVAVAPILVGGMADLIAQGPSPASERLYSGVVQAVQQATAGRRTLLVASGDIAHVGAAFGDPALTPEARAGVLEDDERLLAQLLAGNAAGFFAEILRVENANNVCGVLPIYLLLRTLAGAGAAGGRAPLTAAVWPVTGELTGYAVCPADEHDTSVVTVAGVYLGGASS